MAGSQGPRIWHGGYRSYEEALRKAKTIIYGEGAWINCGLCHPQCVSPDRDHRPSGCGQFHRYRRSAGKPSGPEVRAAVRPKVPRKPGLWPHRQLRLRIAAGGHGVYHFLFARGFATSRAQSMKSCARRSHFITQKKKTASEHYGLHSGMRDWTTRAPRLDRARRRTLAAA